jgi:hypothetical protein
MIINTAKKQLPFAVRAFKKVSAFTDEYSLESSAI